MKIVKQPVPRVLHGVKMTDTNLHALNHKWKLAESRIERNPTGAQKAAATRAYNKLCEALYEYNPVLETNVQARLDVLHGIANVSDEDDPAPYAEDPEPVPAPARRMPNLLAGLFHRAGLPAH